MGELFFMLNQSGLSFTAIGSKYQMSKGQVAGLVKRYKDSLGPDNDFESDNWDRWTEEKLTERWADRNTRLAKERQIAHA